MAARGPDVRSGCQGVDGEAHERHGEAGRDVQSSFEPAPPRRWRGERGQHQQDQGHPVGARTDREARQQAARAPQPGRPGAQRPVGAEATAHEQREKRHIGAGARGELDEHAGPHEGQDRAPGGCRATEIMKQQPAHDQHRIPETTESATPASSQSSTSWRSPAIASGYKGEWNSLSSGSPSRTRWASGTYAPMKSVSTP